MNDNIQIALISSLAILSGALIGVIGQIIGSSINHKKEIEKLRTEFILKEKIESFKKIHKLIYEIKRRTISFLMGAEKDKELINELIFELNNEFFLFSDKKTLTEVKESVHSMQDILDNSPSIVKIKDQKLEINQEELKKIVRLISDAQIKIITAIRRELKI
jgi:hypothetical protein